MKVVKSLVGIFSILLSLLFCFSYCSFDFPVKYAAALFSALYGVILLADYFINRKKRSCSLLQALTGFGVILSILVYAVAVAFKIKIFGDFYAHTLSLVIYFLTAFLLCGLLMFTGPFTYRKYNAFFAVVSVIIGLVCIASAVLGYIYISNVIRYMKFFLYVILGVSGLSLFVTVFSKNK